VIHQARPPAVEEGGLSALSIADVGILLNVELFCVWLSESVGSDRPIAAHNSMDRLGSDLGRFRVVVAIEQLVGAGFPDDLVESIESIGEFYEWTLVKMQGQPLTHSDMCQP